MIKESIVIGDIYKKYQNPLAELVQKACCYDSKLMIERDNIKINMKSIRGIMAIKWDEGMSVTISAEGSDESEACKALADFVACK